MTPTHSADLEERIAALRRRCFFAALVGRATRLGALALVAAGVWALVWRVGLGREDNWSLIGFGAMALVLPVAVLEARRKTPTRASAAIWLDARSGGGGALVTTLELGASREWQAQLEIQSLRTPPPPALRSAAYLGPWPIALVFALACPFVPVAEPNTPLDQGAQVVLENGIEAVREQLATLEENLRLSDEVRAELHDRLERLERDAAGLGLEAGFEGLDTLEEELKRLAQSAALESDATQSALAQAAASSAGNGQQTRANVEEAARVMRASSSPAAADEDLMSKLLELAENAAAGLSAGDRLESLEDFDKWLDWYKEWAALQEATRLQARESLERLAEAGLLDPQQLEEAQSALARLDEATLDRLTDALAKALEDVELDPSEAGELREALAGLPQAPKLSDELQKALADLQAELDERLGAVESPAGPDLVKLFEEIDEDLRAELFEALAEAQARQAAALEKAVALDPQAFELDPQQLETLRQALAASKSQLAEWIAGELAAQSMDSLAALAKALGRRADDAQLDADERRSIEAAFEDLFDLDPKTLAKAVAAIPPQLRNEVLKQLAAELQGGGDAALGLEPEARVELAEVLERIVAGPPTVQPPALTPEQVRRAIEALRAMRPGKPGLGIPNAGGGLGLAGGIAIQSLSSMAAANQRAALQQLAGRLSQMGGSPVRGPGAAPLTFGREAPDRADAFAPQRLTPSGLRDLEHSQLMGVGSTSPTFDPSAEAAVGATFGAGGEASTERRRLAPRHRRAVERFFSASPP